MSSMPVNIAHSQSPRLVYSFRVNIWYYVTQHGILVLSQTHYRKYTYHHLFVKLWALCSC